MMHAATSVSRRAPERTASPKSLLVVAGCALLCAGALAGAPALADEAAGSSGAAPDAAAPVAAAAGPAAQDAAAQSAAQPAPAPEPVDLSGAGNVDIASAAAIVSGQQVTDYADGYGTLKYYRIDLPSAGRLTLDATVPWEGWWGDGTYILVDGAGQTLWSYEARNDWNGTTQQSHSIVSVDLTAGTYYLSVGENDMSGTYTFSVTFEDAGETVFEAQGGSNNTLDAATPVELGVTYTGQTAINDVVDFYRFDLAAPSRLALDAVLTWGRGWDTTYRIFDAEGIELWGYEGRNDWNDVTGQAVTSQCVDLAAGTYYLSVSYSGEDFGPYTFTLTAEDAAESAPETQGGSNNDISSAVPIELGATYRGQLALNDALDFYTFTMPQAGIAYLDVTTAWDSYDRTLFLYDASGNEVWSYSVGGDWNDQLGCTSSMVEIELAEGTYYFAAQNTYDVTGPYEFCWYSDSVPRAAAPGGTASATDASATDAPATEEAPLADGDQAAGTGQAADSDQAADVPPADGTYTAALDGAYGRVEMTVSIEGGVLTAAGISSEGGVTPDEYLALFTSCVDQAREAAAAAGSSLSTSFSSIVDKIAAASTGA